MENYVYISSIFIFSPYFFCSLRFYSAVTGATLFIFYASQPIIIKCHFYILTSANFSACVSRSSHAIRLFGICHETDVSR